MQKLKGIMFDFNGVLVDDYLIQKEAWSRISLELRGETVSDEEMVQQIRGVPTLDTVKWMKEDLSEEENEMWAKKKDKVVEELFDTSPLFKLNLGLEKFLDDLKHNNILITIATSSRKDIFTFAFDKLGLGKWFDKDHILYNDGTYPGKPAPDPYMMAAKKINLSPEECYVFEDALSGIRSAYAAGVLNIIVVGNEERILEFETMPGVVKGIHNFLEVGVEQLFNV